MHNRFALFVTALLLLPCSVQAASSTAPSTVGAGPHGYDVLIGNWSCKNSVPSAMGGPATTTIAIARSVNGALSVHVSGANFSGMGYVVYAPKTKTWWNPSLLANGGYGTESTQQTGKKTVWQGPFTDGSGKSMQIRDTYTFQSATSFTDLSQANTGGAWKTEANTTCTKT